MKLFVVDKVMKKWLKPLLLSTSLQRNSTILKTSHLN